MNRSILAGKCESWGSNLNMVDNKDLVDQLKPESAFFYLEDGKRTGTILFDESTWPRLTATYEPYFAKLNAEIKEGNGGGGPREPIEIKGRYEEINMEMSVDVVTDVYNRFSEGDIDGFLALCADNIEWVVNGPAHLEKCRAFKGRSGVQHFLDLLAGWEFNSFVPREFIVDGSTVVVLGEETGTDKASGIQFTNRWVHVFDVQGGKIVRFREFLCHWTNQQPPAMSWSVA